MIDSLIAILNFLFELLNQFIEIINEYKISDFETAITMIKSGEISGIIIGIIAIIQIIIDKIT